MAMETGRYPIITKVLDHSRPDRHDVRTLVATAIQNGDMSAIHAVAESDTDYLQSFRGNLITMWLVAHRSIETLPWEPLMKWVTAEDLLVAQSVAVRMDRDSVNSAIQNLNIERLIVSDPGTDLG